MLIYFHIEVYKQQSKDEEKTTHENQSIFLFFPERERERRRKRE